MQYTTEARPYARAAFEVAEATNAIAAWQAWLADCALLMAETAFANYVENPKVSANAVSTLFNEVLPTAKAEQQRFIGVVSQASQCKLLPEISALFTKAALSADATVHVVVHSAAELSEAQREKLATALEQRLKQKVQCEFGVEPELIGGVVMQTDEWIIDGSIRGKLNQLKRKVVG